MTDPAGVHEARPEALAGWDDRTVRVLGGDVQQSRAWGEHRARTGWAVHHLEIDDGSAVLALGRPWPLLGGGRLYVPKGPVSAGATAAIVAERLAAVAGWARRAGYDAILADAEIPAATGYSGALAARGFRPVEEVGPSRHRVAAPIPAGADDARLLATIATTTRQMIVAAERHGMRVVCHDAAAVKAAPRGEAPPGDTAPSGATPGPGLAVPQLERPAEDATAAFERFHALLAATGERRGFSIGPRAAAIAWWRAALAAGFLVLLEARSADDAYLGAAIFYRNGERLTYAHSGDVVDLRRAHPGASRLLLWRALQLAAREGRSELDLGGVDVAGARSEPRPGDPMYGLLEFKRSFGGRWVELSGAHELVLRPGRARAGAAIAGVGRRARRLAQRRKRGR
jgi:lipid II:glycine glycyltransferase (peptidoglycan interpeptide bridge formation enzyme)